MLQTTRLSLGIHVLLTVPLLATHPALAGPPLAHIPGPVFNGNNPDARFGRAVRGAGDVNADGFDDVIIGAFGDNANGAGSGSAQVRSGADGSVLYDLAGIGPGVRFGRQVSGAGDSNGDGHADFIVGAPLELDGSGVQTGSARVYSGADGSVLHLLFGEDGGDFFGRWVSAAGDVNDDGFGDVIISAHFDGTNGQNSGAARVFSGIDGSQLFEFFGANPGDRLGETVSGAGDVNADGHADLIVGVPGDDTNGGDAGAARIYSGADGLLLREFLGNAPGDEFGECVDGAGDVDADGFDDIIVGARNNDSSGFASGRADVFSVLDGRAIHTFLGESSLDFFGEEVSGAGDLNLDGHADVIVGAFNASNRDGEASGRAYVYSGATGGLMLRIDGDDPGDRFGDAVSAAGDVNADGVGDLIIGAWGDDNTAGGSGSASLIVSFFGLLPCEADCNGSGAVEFGDLVAMLFAFDDPSPGDQCDVNESGDVDFADLVEALFFFGPCEPG